MSPLLVAVSALHGLILLFLFIATLDKVPHTSQGWWVLPSGGRNIWFDCTFENSSHSWACSSAGDGPWLWGVQGGLLGALLVSSVAFGLFVWQLLAGPRGGLFLAPGGGQLLAGLLVLGGAGLYAARGGHPPGGHFGHCFVLAWLCVPLALGSGITYLHLRKKD